MTHPNNCPECGSSDISIYHDGETYHSEEKLLIYFCNFCSSGFKFKGEPKDINKTFNKIKMPSESTSDKDSRSSEIIELELVHLRHRIERLEEFMEGYLEIQKNEELYKKVIEAEIHELKTKIVNP